MPENHPYTKLLIEQIHKRNLHTGTQQTLASLRRFFWIPHGKKTVRSVIHHCVQCKKLTGGPYQLPQFPPFPKDRVQRVRPFSSIGLDYLGPLNIKLDGRQHKIWVCLFTCLTIRAVHLEIAMDLSAKEFLNCLRRFIARRGLPEKITSDNAPSFKLVCSTFQQVWRQLGNTEDIINYCGTYNIEWHFITELAPWQGGFYERLIGLTKMALKKAIGRRHLHYSEFHTLLTEVEGVLNSRPLTFLYADLDSKNLIRPIDFLHPGAKIGTPILENDVEDPTWFPPNIDSSTKLENLWTSSQSELDQFWEFWKSEYLHSLRERYQRTHKQPRGLAPEQPKVGDIVLIENPLQPRGQWPYGKIIQLYMGNDGVIRSAEVLTPNKRTLRRNIAQLYPLEITSTQEDGNQEDEPKDQRDQRHPPDQDHYQRPITRSITKKMGILGQGAMTPLIVMVTLFICFGVVDAQGQGRKKSEWLLYKAFSQIIENFYLAAGVVLFRKAIKSITDQAKMDNSNHTTFLSECNFKSPSIGRLIPGLFRKDGEKFSGPHTHVKFYPHAQVILKRNHMNKLDYAKAYITSLAYQMGEMGLHLALIPKLFYNHCLETLEYAYCHPEWITLTEDELIDLEDWIFDDFKFSLHPGVQFHIDIDFDIIHPLLERPTDSFIVYLVPRNARRLPTKTSSKIVSRPFQGTLPSTNTILIITMALLALLTPCQGSFCTTTYGLQKVDSQSCVSSGIVVYKNKQNQNLCYKFTNCSTGHLNGKGNCGPKCPCPSWAQGCSFYPGPEPPTIGHKESILGSVQPSYCSLTPDTRCNKNPTHTVINQIQLYDNSIHQVTTLQLQHMDSVGENYICLGGGATVTGTEDFCTNHECSTSAQKFCYYKDPGPTYLITELGQLPIKAWGQIPFTFYGTADVLPEAPICHDCKLKCIPGGVEIQIGDIELGMVEICSKPYCYQIANPKESFPMLFPAEVNLQIHEFETKFWSNGLLIKHHGIQCPAQPYCEMIHCYFCLNRLANPQCAPKLALLLIFIGIYFGSVTLLVLIKILKYLLLGIFISGKLFCVLCHKGTNRTYHRLYNNESASTRSTASRTVASRVSHNSPSLKSATNSTRSPTTVPRYVPPHKRLGFQGQPAAMIYITCLIFLWPLIPIQGCSEVITLTAQRSKCVVTSHGALECVLSEVTRLGLVPQGQDTCLLVKDPNGEPMGTLAIQVDRIRLECQKKNDYFTRSFRMGAVAIKRCWTKGSCTGNKCEETTTSTKIEELGRANQYPGYTHCAASCGCWGCSCFFCTDASLFYRTFAYPTSATIYEVYTCPIWIYKVTLLAQLTLGQETIEEQITLCPGTSHQLKGLRISLVSITSPPLPVLGAQFLTDGSRTVMVKASSGGQPVSGTIGSLQCENRQQANTFNCYLAHDMCLCDTLQETVRCNCADMTLEELYQKREHLLPMQTQGITLLSTGNQVEAEYNTIAALEIQVALDGLHLTTQVHKNKCTIRKLGWEGCYQCLSGATLTYDCQTDFGEALAHVNCGPASFSTACTTTRKPQITKLNFQTAKISLTCEVHCPAGTTTFDLNEELYFIPKTRIGNLSNILAEQGDLTDNNNFNIDLGFLGSFLAGNWLIGIILTALIFLLLCLTVPLLPES